MAFKIIEVQMLMVTVHPHPYLQLTKTYILLQLFSTIDKLQMKQIKTSYHMYFPLSTFHQNRQGGVPNGPSTADSTASTNTTGTKGNSTR